MSTELVLRYSDVTQLRNDFESNLRRGRAFVPNVRGIDLRQTCVLRIDHPQSGKFLELQVEAVWICEPPLTEGVGFEFLNFDTAKREALEELVNADVTPAFKELAGPVARDVGNSDEQPVDSPPTARNLHDRVRELDISERDALARQGSLPERVALERRYGSSVWEGLLHNPQVTAREVSRMAKSSSLATSLVNLIVANKAWLSDAAVQKALLENPRVSGAHLERVLRALPQSEVVRIAESTSVRMQVRVAAKKFIRR